MSSQALRAGAVETYFRLRRLLRQPIYSLRGCSVAFSGRIEGGCVLVNSSVGAYSYLGGGVYLHTTRLGNYCSIAAGVKIGGMEHSWWWGSTSPRLSTRNIDGKPTVVGDDVWIGTNAVVRQGVHIGRGAVIGAGSVVLESVPPYAIVAGIPARLIRNRFADELAQRVESTKFWEFPPRQARQLLEAIDYSDLVGECAPDGVAATPADADVQRD